MRSLTTRRIEATFEVDPIETTDGDELLFRIEVFLASGQYSAKLFRWESFRVHPSFTPDTEVADHVILVEDSTIGLSCISEPTVEATIAAALRILEKQLSKKSQG